MHLSASLLSALVLMLKRSCLLAYVGNRCLLGRRANEVILCSYPFGACLVQCKYPLDPAHSRKNVNQTPSLVPLVWNERESLIGILIMPTENFWPEFFHRTCHLSDGCFFLDQLLGFPDWWNSLN